MATSTWIEKRRKLRFMGIRATIDYFYRRYVYEKHSERYRNNVLRCFPDESFSALAQEFCKKGIVVILEKVMIKITVI